MCRLIPLLILGFAVPSQVTAQSAQPMAVRYVTDGDTFRLTSGERIRIAGIDAPEIHADQAKCARELESGRAAKASLEMLIGARQVVVTRVGRSYNRTVARVKVGGRDLAASLIAAGRRNPGRAGGPNPTGADDELAQATGR